MQAADRLRRERDIIRARGLTRSPSEQFWGGGNTAKNTDGESIITTPLNNGPRPQGGIAARIDGGLAQSEGLSRSQRKKKRGSLLKGEVTVYLRFVYKLNASGVGAEVDKLEVFSKSRGFLSIPKAEFPFSFSGTNFIHAWILNENNISSWEKTPIYLTFQQFFPSLSAPRTEFYIYRKFGNTFDLVSTVIFRKPGNHFSGFYFPDQNYYMNQSGYLTFAFTPPDNYLVSVQSVFSINKNILSIGQSFGPNTATEVVFQLNSDFSVTDTGTSTDLLLSSSSIIKTTNTSFTIPIAVASNRAAFVNSNFSYFAIYTNTFYFNGPNAQIKIDFNDGGQVYTLADTFIDVTPGTFLYNCFGQFIFDKSGDLILTVFQAVPNDVPDQHQIFLYRVVLGVDGKLTTKYQKTIKGPKEFFSYGPVNGQYFTNYFPQIHEDDCLNEGKKLVP